MAKHGPHGNYGFRPGKRFERELLAQARTQSVHFKDKLRARRGDGYAICFDGGQSHSGKFDFNIHDELAC
jgi:hypothetical protein